MSEGPKRGRRIANQLSEQEFGHRIPEIPAVDTPLKFRHFVLTMTRGKEETNRKRGLPSRSLVFFKVERTPADKPVPKNQAEAEALARRIVENAPAAYPYKRSTSFDFARNLVPGWILLELDPTINWQFPMDHPGATTKTKDRSALKPSGRPLNGNLRYIHVPDGATKAVVTTQAPENECRFILFAALERETSEDGGVKGQKFNFIVEFYQRVANGEPYQTIPLIIDPDFPSDGPPGGP